MKTYPKYPDVQNANDQMCSKVYSFCLVFIMVADCQEGPWKRALLIVWMVLFMSVTMKCVWSKPADSSQYCGSGCTEMTLCSEPWYQHISLHVYSRNIRSADD